MYDNAASRALIFSSFSTLICTLLNWKQPNYGVFYRTYLGYDNRGLSLKDSIKFAKQNDILGIIAYGAPMITRPILITCTKERGLVVVIFGVDDASVAMQSGCDGYIKSDIFSYKQEQSFLF